MLSTGVPLTPPLHTATGGPWWVGVLIIVALVAGYVLYGWRMNAVYWRAQARKLDEPSKPAGWKDGKRAA